MGAGIAEPSSLSCWPCPPKWVEGLFSEPARSPARPTVRAGAGAAAVAGPSGPVTLSLLTSSHRAAGPRAAHHDDDSEDQDHGGNREPDEPPAARRSALDQGTDLRHP